MIDNAPLNIILANTELVITYLNPSSYRLFKTIEHLLPCKVEEIVGKSVDTFHKAPELQRKLLLNPKNLPYQADIQLGEHTLELLATAIFDDQGRYLGPITFKNSSLASMDKAEK
jgi:methyl-accepting chemotaxis protein